MPMQTHMQTRRNGNAETLCLELFRRELETEGLGRKTVSRHVANAAFYLYYLQYKENPAASVAQGCGACIRDFLGSFYPQQAACTSSANFSAMAVSIRKFYKCMLDLGKVPAEQYAELCRILKDEMPAWRAMCKCYLSPSGFNPYRRRGPYRA